MIILIYLINGKLFIPFNMTCHGYCSSVYIFFLTRYRPSGDGMQLNLLLFLAPNGVNDVIMFNLVQ